MAVWWCFVCGVSRSVRGLCARCGDEAVYGTAESPPLQRHDRWPHLTQHTLRAQEDVVAMLLREADITDEDLVTTVRAAAVHVCTATSGRLRANNTVEDEAAFGAVLNAAADEQERRNVAKAVSA